MLRGCSTGYYVLVGTRAATNKAKFALRWRTGRGRSLHSLLPSSGSAGSEWRHPPIGNSDHPPPRWNQAFLPQASAAISLPRSVPRSTVSPFFEALSGEWQQWWWWCACPSSPQLPALVVIRSALSTDTPPHTPPRDATTAAAATATACHYRRRRRRPVVIVSEPTREVSQPHHTTAAARCLRRPARPRPQTRIHTYTHVIPLGRISE